MGNQSVEPAKDLDQQQMIRVKAGERAAFEGLYQRYWRPVMSYILQLVQNQMAAEELTQEVFLKVYRARESYEPRAKFSTWLWTIARNTAFDHLARKGEVLAESTESNWVEEFPVQDEDGAEAQLIKESERKKVEACMSALSLPQREALTLRTVSELAYEEVAATMKITLAAVKSLIFRAKQALIHCLGGTKHESTRS